MKSDLDRLMNDRGFDCLIVMGEAEGNHALRYLSNGAKLTHGLVIKKQGQQPTLVVGGMERDEAAKSGLPVVMQTDFNYTEHYRETGDALEARIRMFGDMFEHFGIEGVVSFYGVSDPGGAYVFLSRLQEAYPNITVTGEPSTTIFDLAYSTKGPDELAAITDVAQRTNAVFAETIAYLKEYRAEEGRLVKESGDPLTVGEVKQWIRARLNLYDLEEAHEMIFAIGRDAGVPHSRGEATDPLALGQTIVFDLFPRDPATGYFHDMTRTLCLGYATDEVQRVYDQVMQAFNTVMERLALGEPTSSYQELTAEIFEEHGHVTRESDPATTNGYVHSLGHGLGLQLHAAPRLSTQSKETLQPWQVFSVEPGLYYPEKGYGIRVEDTVYIDEEGTVHSLTNTPKDLVIPIEGG